jgi:DNA-binding NtrC family response regulator
VRLLIVEDERALRESLSRYLAGRGYEVQAVADGKEAVELMQRRSFGILLSDIRLPGMDGISLLRTVRELSPETKVLLMTAFASVETAVQSLREGAFDYLLKPLILEDLAAKVDHVRRFAELARECTRLRQELARHRDDETMIGSSRAMQEVLRLIDKVSVSPSNVLVTGESGTGKELVARAIHRRGPSAGGPFIAVNVAAVPRDLVESHLFGHEKGAFTGAERRRDGVLRAATGGCAFLDEIGEMPLDLQAKLLRAIEEKEVFPVGGDSPVRVSARIIAATHRDLARMVEEGTFRQDLYYRLNVVRIHVPALRERSEDIPALVSHFVARHAREQGRPPPPVSEEAMGILMAHEWRGNIRELSNVVERALLLGDAAEIGVNDLPADLLGRQPAATISLKEATDDFERRHIARVLHQVGGNRQRAAQLLGVSEATLYRKLDLHGLKGSREDESAVK